MSFFFDTYLPFLTITNLIFAFVAFIVVRHLYVLAHNRWLLPQHITPDERKFRNEAVSIGISVFLYMVGTEFTRPFFPLYVETFSESVGYLDKNTLMALPQILWGILALIGTPLGLWLNRELGARHTFLIASILTTLALLSMGSTENYWEMLVYRGVNALCMGIVAVVAVLVLFREASVIRLNVFLSAVASGSICANVLGGWVAKEVGYSATILVSSAIAFLSFLTFVSFFAPWIEGYQENKKLSAKDYRFVLSRLRIHLYALLVCTPSRLVLTGFIFYMLPIYLHKLGFNTAVAGQIMMCYFALNYIIVKKVSQFLARTQHFRISTLVSSLSLAAGLLIFAVSGNFVPGLICSMALFSVGMTLGNAVQVPLIPRIFQEEISIVGKDSLIAFFRTVERVATVLGPLWAAILLEYASIHALYVFTALLLLFSFLTALWFGYERQKRKI